MSNECARLMPARFGFAWGLMWGLGWMLLGWAGWVWGYALPLIKIMSSAYLGFAPTFMGGVIGGVEGFIDVFIFAWLVALIYNCCCKGSCPKT